MSGRIRWSVVLGSVPFLTLVLALPFVNRLRPLIFGMPFILFWILFWILITPALLFAAYRWESRRRRSGDGGRP
ncbi:MAG: DUF3311 domain-containing protein [Candidatus Aminicenantales bacterium]|jgi:uncharacterized iron-regulated membrane protein